MPKDKFDDMLAFFDPYITSLAIGCIREPLVHPAIKDILVSADKCSERTSLSLSTNATVLDESICDLMIRANHDWSFNISIESASPKIYESIRRGARFESFDRNVKYLCSMKSKREGIKISFSTVVMKNNIYVLDELLEYACHLGIDNIILMDLEPHEHNLHLVLSSREKDEFKSFLDEFRDRAKNRKIRIGTRTDPSGKGETTAVMNQRGDVYPMGYRKPVGNVFENSGFELIMKHYQCSINLK